MNGESEMPLFIHNVAFLLLCWKIKPFDPYWRIYLGFSVLFSDISFPILISRISPNISHTQTWLIPDSKKYISSWWKLISIFNFIKISLEFIILCSNNQFVDSIKPWIFTGCQCRPIVLSIRTVPGKPSDALKAMARKTGIIETAYTACQDEPHGLMQYLWFMNIH